LIAKPGKNHIIVENLILPVAAEIVPCIFGEKEAKRVKAIPLSNDPVSRRISDMAYDTEEQLVGTVRGRPRIGIQCDETQDVTGIAQLIVFARVIFQNTIFEDIYFVRHLKHRKKVKIFSS